MEAGTVDTVNRLDAQLGAAHLDALDVQYSNGEPWYRTAWSDLILSDERNSDRAWFVGAILKTAPGTRFDDFPADNDWENLFSHFRAEILARRNPQARGETSPAYAAETPARDGVGSR